MEVIRDSAGHPNIVFELAAGGNLESLTRQRTKPLSEAQIRTIFYQMLLAVDHMHSANYMHRDIKPENVFLASSPRGVDDIHVKVGDLGLAKRTSARNGRPHTTYISTRWYRSPEILLRMADYSFPSDMWAVGAVMAEVVAHGDPLFPGSDEDDQLVRVVKLRGHPSIVGWKRGESAMKSRGLELPKFSSKPLVYVLTKASSPVLQLISDLLELDPTKRPTAAQALSYPVFIPMLESSFLHSRMRKRSRFSSNEFDDGDIDDNKGGEEDGKETAGTLVQSARWSPESDEEDFVPRSFMPRKHASGHAAVGRPGLLRNSHDARLHNFTLEEGKVMQKQPLAKRFRLSDETEDGRQHAGTTGRALNTIEQGDDFQLTYRSNLSARKGSPAGDFDL